MDDAPQLLALGVDDVETAGAAAVEVARRIHLEAVGRAGLCAAKVHEHAARLLEDGAVGLHVVGADVTAPRVGHIEHALVGRECEAVGPHHVVDDERHRAEIRRHAVDARKRHVPLIGRGGAAGIGEVDRAVGFHDHVVGAEQTLALKAVGDHRDAAVGLVPRHAPGQVLGGNQPALQVARHAVGLVGLLHRDGHPLARGVFDPSRGMDVVEEQVAPLGPPERAFGGADVAAVAGGQLADGLAGSDDAVQLRRHRLDPLCGLSPRRQHAGHGQATNGAGRPQEVTP